MSIKFAANAIGVLAVLYFSPQIIHATQTTTESAVKAMSCRFDPEQIKKLKQNMDEETLAKTEKFLAGKSCSEVVKWINNQWQAQYEQAQVDAQ